ncbi:MULTISPECIES: hypothetical protein [Campylobacter]|uniref:hypothetical protein n=1 Tax=Campylobacter TaxID=194 RepID=UPI00027A38EF|nr:MULTISPECIES: hypothetical protein [Campylobacter]EJP75334.1 hypothetical protein HMPREF1139_0759 [Campylobacter sp. FOBRC14]
MLNLDEKSLALTLSRLIATHKFIFLMNFAMFFIAILRYDMWQKVVMAAFFIYILYLHIRLSFDAFIMQDFSHERLEAQKFDSSLRTLGLAKNMRPADMKSRCKGAIGLYKKLVFASVFYLLLGLVLDMRYAY